VSVKQSLDQSNPFNSMYFAKWLPNCQQSISNISNQKGKKISMLAKSSFTKKATGRITFVCKDGHLIEKAIQETLQVRADILDELLQLTKRRSGIRNGF
jgi:hypothetical protein